MIPALRPGDKIAIVATARKITLPEIELAIRTFKDWGLQVILGESIGASYNYFAGNDALRLQDLQQMLDNDSIKAIICARGGYGTTRIIDQVDFTIFQQHPKWLVGFSDVTALHSHIHNLGLESIHAIMPLLFPKEGTADSIETLRRVLFGEDVVYTAAPHAFNRTGTAIGQLVGGNLSMLHTLTGTRSDISTEGKILFLEDLCEYLYHVDRMMVHMDRSGKLENLAGLVIGDMSDMNDTPVPFGKTAYEIILEHTGKYNYPVAYGFPVGHEPLNLALICGRETALAVSESGVQLTYC
ncbi:muramoyltetrapeptide carboxypeptidase [Pontibacter ummariensis]|uniref:Muramoyltetrapeptide carboxypeptidase n=1 Tax=Pontibacter ummariensis TaxID=1610492 RepID=A0A239HRN5_9BACT|nr:LD-carboxypeptidase [Pontibacter ummariensis]PRY10400.1 muramoyltetrapeptide carboxypeptidase [Pontibacter ummariensis]SNS83930.1 muramoyltetrapeptide carboxypeptidase [Pontibacter ummariensis]